MLQRLSQPQNYVHLTVQKAISLLDKLYDTFFAAPRKTHINLFTKHFIKIEFLDKLCRPVFKEFDEWPHISLEPDPPKEKREEKETPENLVNAIPSNNNNIQKMTRKSRPRIKEKEDKEQRGGYCEMCNADYVDAALHRRSPHHLAFVRDHTNFLALDSLITSGADVTTFLDKATPVNGERRSLRKLCNGDTEPKTKTKKSHSPDNINGNTSPKRNGGLEEDKKRKRCSKRTSESQTSEDRQYYKVVGVSTKLRSSGGFAVKKKESPPTVNGTKPLVVKFRKIRQSELSVLSDEAEQFMFPKRASSTSSTSSDEDEKVDVVKSRKKSPPKPPPPIERQRLARPVALKEESSEEDSWPEDKRRKKRRVPPVAKRARRTSKAPTSETFKLKEKTPEPDKEQSLDKTEPEVSPLREVSERCMKWEDGKLKYTPAVEQLEFAFESVPHSEPWFETFKRQDQDKLVTKNVPQYFELYSKSPKLPYEIGQLPPLKPNCCPLSDLVKREKPGPSRSYGTRGMKKKRIRKQKRTTALIALERHPRKSPREHASTLAILGSAGLLHRRKHDDAKSTASEDTISDTHSNMKIEPVLSETQEASERLQQFLSEVFEEPTDYDIADDLICDDTAVIAAKTLPDVSSLVSECEDCDIIRNEINQESTRTRIRRGKFKKKNKTGWPNKKKSKKTSRTSSVEPKDSSLDRSSVEPDDDTTQDTMSDQTLSENEKDDKTLTELQICESPNPIQPSKEVREVDEEQLQLDLKVVVHDKVNEKSPIKSDEKDDKRSSSEGDEEKKKKKRALQGLLLQPIVRVARVNPNAGRRLRSASRARTNRFR